MSLRELILKADEPDHAETGIAVICRGQDQSEFPCRMSIGHVDSNGEFNYIVIARDETSRVRAERRIADINRKLVDSSHKAGMAEVATGVLHNVGNALNSVNISAGVIAGSLSASPIPRLVRAAEILNENRGNLADFMENHPQGKFFCDYISTVSKTLNEERLNLMAENERLQDHIQHIRAIVRAQQNQACGEVIRQTESVAELINQAVDSCRDRHTEYDIEIKLEPGECGPIVTDRHKILQVLVNLVSNAQDAVRSNQPESPPIVTVGSRMIGNDVVEISVQDNGIGISKEDLEQVFHFGFTTKDDGHGFGLHSCVIAAKNLGGRIRVESDGLLQGSRFTLTLPTNPEKEKRLNQPNFALSSAAQTEHEPIPANTELTAEFN